MSGQFSGSNRETLIYHETLGLRPENKELLAKKLIQYRSRIDGTPLENDPWDHINEKNAHTLYQIEIVSRLLADNTVDKPETRKFLKSQIQKSGEIVPFFPDEFESAWAIVKDYNETGGQHVQQSQRNP